MFERNEPASLERILDSQVSRISTFLVEINDTLRKIDHSIVRVAEAIEELARR